MERVSQLVHLGYSLDIWLLSCGWNLHLEIELQTPSKTIHTNVRVASGQNRTPGMPSRAKCTSRETSAGFFSEESECETAPASYWSATGQRWSLQAPARQPSRPFLFPPLLCPLLNLNMARDYDVSRSRSDVPTRTRFSHNT